MILKDKEFTGPEKEYFLQDQKEKGRFWVKVKIDAY